MIELDKITISRGEKVLLRDISISVKHGEKAVVTGPSGCGKTSLLSAIVGCFPVESGKIEVDGIVLDTGSVRQVRHKVAFIGQEPVLGGTTVKEAMELPFTFHANRKIVLTENKMLETLQQLHLSEDIFHKECKSISGGERQRVAIARALLLGKNIFIADELTSALDKKSASTIVGIFKELDVTILSVSHDQMWISEQDTVYRFDATSLLPVEGGELT